MGYFIETDDSPFGFWSKNASIEDSPYAAGGDSGWYVPSSNPTGWYGVKFVFETFAFCNKGTDCAKFYEGIRWIYERNWLDSWNLSPGRSKITIKNLGEPSKNFTDAVLLFSKIKGWVPCLV